MGLALRPIIKQPSDSGHERAGVPTLDLRILWRFCGRDRSREESTDGVMSIQAPLHPGHENAGWIAALGQGVMGFKEGDAVAVYGPWGCGRCHACQLSMENSA